MCCRTMLLPPGMLVMTSTVRARPCSMCCVPLRMYCDARYLPGSTYNLSANEDRATRHLPIKNSTLYQILKHILRRHRNYFPAWRHLESSSSSCHLSPGSSGQKFCTECQKKNTPRELFAPPTGASHISRKIWTAALASDEPM